MGQVAMTTPLVSVLMCAFNGRGVIEQAVADICAQTYRNWELLIGDDGSTDGTREWLSGLHDDPRIRVFFRPYNLGYVRNKNALLAAARGEFVTQQDQDDRTSPVRLERQIAILQESGLKIAGCGFRRVDGRGHVLFEVSPGNNAVITRKPANGYPFWFPPLMVKRDVYEHIGNYSTYFSGVYGDDLYWTVCANEQFPIICISDVLYSYTDAPNSITSFMNNPRKLIIEKILELLIKQRISTGTDDLALGKTHKLQMEESRLLRNRHLISSRYQLYAARSIDHGRFSQARALLWQAIVVAPWRLSLGRTAVYYVRKWRQDRRVHGRL